MALGGGHRPGTVWILDRLEVTIVRGGRRYAHQSGQRAVPEREGHRLCGLAGHWGACSGALFLGYLTDRFGRKKLFMITLAIYLAATALTAPSFSAW
jgi:hypothetical protein